MPTAGYVRVSKDDQPDSPGRQKLQIERCAAELGLTVTNWQEDDETPGWVDKRPGLMRLVEQAESGSVTSIIVDEQSRLTRDEHWDFIAKYGYRLRESGVKVYTAKDGLIDWDSFLGQMQFGFNQYKSQMEVEDLGRRAAGQLTKLAAEGKLFPGKPPLGYAYETDHKGNRTRLIPGDPGDIAKVRGVFADYAAGACSLADLTQRYGLSRTTIAAMFDNESYIGTYRAGRFDRSNYYSVGPNGAIHKTAPKRDRTGKKRPRKKKGHPVRKDRELWTVIPDSHEPLIDRATWEQVQARRRANRKNTAPKRNGREYPLSGFLVCSHCGSTMHGTVDSGQRRIYRCQGAQSKKCKNYSVREEDVVPLIVSEIRDELLRPENLLRLRERLDAVRASFQQGSAQQLVRDQIAELDKQIASTRKVMLALTDAEEVPAFEGKLRTIKSERATLQARLAELTRAAAPRTDPISNLEAVAELAADAPPPILRAALRAAFERVELRFGVISSEKKSYYPLESMFAVLSEDHPGLEQDIRIEIRVSLTGFWKRLRERADGILSAKKGRPRRS